MEDRRWKRGEGRGEGIEGTEGKRGRQEGLRASSFSSYIDYIFTDSVFHRSRKKANFWSYICTSACTPRLLP